MSFHYPPPPPWMPPQHQAPWPSQYTSHNWTYTNYNQPSFNAQPQSNTGSFFSNLRWSRPPQYPPPTGGYPYPHPHYYGPPPPPFGPGSNYHSNYSRPYYGGPPSGQFPSHYPRHPTRYSQAASASRGRHPTSEFTRHTGSSQTSDNPWTGAGKSIRDMLREHISEHLSVRAGQSTTAFDKMNLDFDGFMGTKKQSETARKFKQGRLGELRRFHNDFGPISKVVKDKTEDGSLTEREYESPWSKFLFKLDQDLNLTDDHIITFSECEEDYFDIPTTDDQGATDNQSSTNGPTNGGSTSRDIFSGCDGPPSGPWGYRPPCPPMLGGYSSTYRPSRANHWPGPPSGYGPPPPYTPYPSHPGSTWNSRFRYGSNANSGYNQSRPWRSTGTGWHTAR
uniref:Uncharacterized protein n=1 Tax=Kwoniella bestiolae CBS 10118 TaxID=1296100 RepID=A0A1B9G7L2_9TREE|nr:hypothetical protein I302_01854 [Kwoniella bestiolae CBS 10118]OCF27019.1 hypothetical protein I302_01854 [Kwoniella bestiolae CBS 10118]